MKPTPGRIVHYYHSKWPDEPIAALVTSALPLAQECSSLCDLDAEENTVAIRFQLFCSTEQKSALGESADNEFAWFSSKPRPGYWSWPSKT